MTNDNDERTGAEAVDALLAAHLPDEAVWHEPPADLLDRILVELDTAEPAGEAAAGERPVWARRGGSRLVAAAAAVIIVASGFLAGLLVGRDGGSGVADGDEPVAVLQLAGTVAAPAAAADVEVFAREAGFSLYLAVTGLDPAPADGFYEGRLRAGDGDEVGVGTFHMRGGDGTVVLWSGVGLADYPTLVIVSHDGDEVMTGAVSDPSP